MRNKKYAVLAVCAAVAGAFLAFHSQVQGREGPGLPQMKLGGAFIGSGEGMIWNAFQIPLDPAGRTAALQVNAITYSPALAGLLAEYGADALNRGGAAGQMEMVGRDTAQWRVVSYGVDEGNPPLIRAIIVYSGTAQFTDADTAILNYRVDVYPAAADIDGDGLPDAGTPLTIPGQTATAKRVTP
jgi:hypothetical protein